MLCWFLILNNCFLETNSFMFFCILWLLSTNIKQIVLIIYFLKQKNNNILNKFTDNPINRRFSDVYDCLLKNKIIENKSDLAQKLNTYNHVINNILKGNRSVTIDQLNKLFYNFNINPSFIFGLSDQIFQKSESGQNWLDNIKLVDKEVLAGTGINIEEGEVDIIKFGIPGVQGPHVAFRTEGDSMYPTIRHGDLLVCEEVYDYKLLKDNQIHVIIGDVSVVKRIQHIRGTGIVKFKLISDNPIYPEYEIEETEIKKILKVKGRFTRHSLH